MINGATGSVKFNDAGDRLNSIYKIINKQSDDVSKIVGYYSHDATKVNTLYYYVIYK